MQVFIGTTTVSVLYKNFDLKAYKVQSVQELKPTNHW